MKFKKKLLALSGNNQSGSSTGTEGLKALQKTEGWKNLWHGWTRVRRMRRSWNGSSIFTHLETGIFKAFLYGSPINVLVSSVTLYLVSWESNQWLAASAMSETQEGKVEVGNWPLFFSPTPCLLPAQFLWSSTLTDWLEQPGTQHNALSRLTPGALNAKQNSRRLSLSSQILYILCFLRYSPRTITTLQNMDLERIDLELLVRVISHISLQMEVQLSWA